jgi:hypothetical protein
MFLCGLFLLGSCQTYKYGYWGKLPDSETITALGNDSATQILHSLTLEKQGLTNEAYLIAQEITEKVGNSSTISMHTFNSLFGNLHRQYEIDTVYHQLFQQSPDDSIRNKSKQALLESAVNYKKAFQNNKFIRRTINRGDIAYGIPTNTLNQTQQFLWSDKNNRSYLVKHEKDKRATHTIAGFMLSKSVDKWHSYQYQTVYLLSKIFGQFAGQFHGKIDKKPMQCS